MDNQFKLSMNDSVIEKLQIYGCHTQAVMSCLEIQKRKINPVLFEIVTTVPFGIRCVRDNPNRLIDSIIDPDVGINIAFDLLGVDYSYNYFLKNDIAEQDLAIYTLIKMLKTGPVILGPINMGLLSYYYNHFQYIGIDHYVVALDYLHSTNQLILLDPERIGVVTLKIEDFIPSWFAENLIEGRGSFTMRQIKHVPNDFNLKKILDEIVRIAAINIETTTAQVHKEFSLTKISKRNNSSLWKGLFFCTNNRVRKLFCYHMLILKLDLCKNDLRVNILRLINKQINICQMLIKQLQSCNEIIPYEIEEIIKLELQIGKCLYRISQS